MVNAVELQIGNYINVYDGLKPGKLSMAEVVNVYGEEELRGCLVRLLDENVHASMPEKLIHPIPITEEWLLNFGFQTTEATGVFRKDKVYCDTHSLAIELNFPSPNKIILTQDLKYVHQLQNLYFALTNYGLSLIAFAS